MHLRTLCWTEGRVCGDLVSYRACRYSAVRFAEGQQLRRGGSGVRPEPAKTKSLPPPDTKSAMKAEKDGGAVAPPAKAQSAVASQFTVREGVQSVAKA